MQNRELWNYRQMLDYWVNWLGKQDRHWTLLRMICSQYQMNWLSFIIMCAQLMGRHQAEFFWTMKSMVAWHQASKGVCNTSRSVYFTLLWWMSSLKFCIWQGTNNTHPCEPKFHRYNIRNAKGSYLLIMPLDVWADDSQACRVPRGKPEMSQTKNTQHIYYFITCTMHLLLFCTIWPTNAQLIRGRVGCLRQPTLPLSIRINTGSLYRNVSILNYKRDKDNVS